MSKNIKQIKLFIEDMSCSACELKLEKKLKGQNGVIYAKASYANGCIDVSYDTNCISVSQLENAIGQAGYTLTMQKPVQNSDNSFLIAAFLMILLAYTLIKNTIGFNFIPSIEQNMGYGVLFIVGLITSVHCLAMCGGINLSQTISTQKTEGFKRIMPSLLYNGGRVVSYTAVGGIVGGLGSVIEFTGALKGVVAVVSGLFMLIMGLNLLNIFPALKKINIKMPSFFAKKIFSGKHSNHPFIVGLLNGLMPCGPLQAIQLYALGTGSAFKGALSMLMFSLGTLPLMFIFGAVSSFLSNKLTTKMFKLGGALVMVLGLVMVNRGLSLSGVAFGAAPAASSKNIAVVSGDIQEVTTSFSSGRYAPITVQSGIPVRWVVKVTEKDLNGCNNPFIIPEYGIEAVLKPGENIIEFTPQGAGKVPYSCWMGMIRSSITIVDNL